MKDRDLPSTPDDEIRRKALSGLTRVQFIVQMILAYGRIYPGIKAKEAMPMAARTYRDFIDSERIKFGDPRYGWTQADAETLVREYENQPPASDCAIREVEFGSVRGSLDKMGRRVDPVKMPDSLKRTIATCYGLLWHVETDSKYVHRARRGLLQWITKDEQAEGIELARAIALANLIPLPDGAVDHTFNALSAHAGDAAKESGGVDSRCDYCKENGFQHPDLCEDCRKPGPSDTHAEVKG
jgi:hypothetical protein